MPPDQTTVTHKLYKDLLESFPVEYDETQAVGKRCRRQDEIGTPWGARRGNSAGFGRLRAPPAAPTLLTVAAGYASSVRHDWRLARSPSGLAASPRRGPSA